MLYKQRPLDEREPFHHERPARLAQQRLSEVEAGERVGRGRAANQIPGERIGDFHQQLAATTKQLLGL